MKVAEERTGPGVIWPDGDGVHELARSEPAHGDDVAFNEGEEGPAASEEERADLEEEESDRERLRDGD